MKSKLMLLALVASGCCFAQDQITTRYNAKINAKVTGETKATVKYTKPDVPGNDYLMDKGDIVEIKYEDGRTVTFAADIFENLSASETESRIVEIISQNAFNNEKDMNPLKANFSGGKLVVSGKNFNEGAFDLKDVKSFPPVSKKQGDLANVSVWAMGADNATSAKFEKRRLIFLVKGQDTAFELYNLMKHLNNALKAQK